MWRSLIAGTWHCGKVQRRWRHTSQQSHTGYLLVSIKELWNPGLCPLHYPPTRSLWAQTSSSNYYQVLCKGRWGVYRLNYLFYIFKKEKHNGSTVWLKKKNICTNEAPDYQMETRMETKRGWRLISLAELKSERVSVSHRVTSLTPLWRHLAACFLKRPRDLITTGLSQHKNKYIKQEEVSEQQMV